VADGEAQLARGYPPWHEWQYVKVGRLFPYVEESIDHGTQWAVFEPNEEPLSELNTH
jgi:phage tail sheath protein FI